MIKWLADESDPDYCKPCECKHGPLYICKHYSKEKKAGIRKSIPKPPKKYLFQTGEGELIVWVSEDKKYLVGWGAGIFMGGYHLFKRVGDTDKYEQPNYGTIYITADGAKEAIGKLDGLNG